jgi:hypothetical protein
MNCESRPQRLPVPQEFPLMIRTALFPQERIACSSAAVIFRPRGAVSFAYQPVFASSSTETDSTGGASVGSQGKQSPFAQTGGATF